MSKQTIKILLRTAVSVSLLAWLACTIDWYQLAASLRIVRLEWIMGALGWIIISIVISTYKWQGVLTAQGLDLSWRELWKAYWVGQFFNNFLPSSIGGDAMRIIWVKDLSGDAAGAAASVIVERILATVGLAVTGLLGGLLVWHSDYRVMAVFMVLILFCGVLMLVITRGRLPAWMEKRPGRILDFFKALQAHGSRIDGRWSSILGVTLLSVAFQVAVVGVNCCIFQALNIRTVGILDVLYIIPLASVAAMLPLGINGYGLREGAYVALLALYSVPRGTAFAASLLFAFLVSLCSLYGAWIWLTQRSKEVISDVGYHGR
ncbi:MAG: lysylphosphatidylglycerol synthase transmembrane domain-containing protein [Syntrophomonas sp.]